MFPASRSYGQLCVKLYCFPGRSAPHTQAPQKKKEVKEVISVVFEIYPFGLNPPELDASVNFI